MAFQPAENEPDSFYQYMRDLGGTELLTREQEIALAKKIKRGNAKARAHFIEANLRLVVKIARDYARYGLPLSDLISEGNIGLMKAVEKFDPAKGARFSTYGAWWIKQNIKRALANQSRLIRLPGPTVDILVKINRANRQITAEIGREATDEEISEEIGVKLHKVRMIRTAALSPTSLNYQPESNEGMGSEIGDRIADPNAVMPDEHAAMDEDLRALVTVVELLDPREREILERRFGLNGREAQTLEQVGVVFGVTRERIRQLQNITFEKIRKMKRKGLFKPGAAKTSEPTTSKVRRVRPLCGSGPVSIAAQRRREYNHAYYRNRKARQERPAVASPNRVASYAKQTAREKMEVSTLSDKYIRNLLLRSGLNLTQITAQRIIERRNVIVIRRERQAARRNTSENGIGK